MLVDGFQEKKGEGPFLKFRVFNTVIMAQKQSVCSVVKQASGQNHFSGQGQGLAARFRRTPTVGRDSKLLLINLALQTHTCVHYCLGPKSLFWPCSLQNTPSLDFGRGCLRMSWLRIRAALITTTQTCAGLRPALCCSSSVLSVSVPSTLDFRALRLYLVCPFLCISYRVCYGAGYTVCLICAQGFSSFFHPCNNY